LDPLFLTELARTWEGVGAASLAVNMDNCDFIAEHGWGAHR
jgi:hypothetical protein